MLLFCWLVPALFAVDTNPIRLWYWSVLFIHSYLICRSHLPHLLIIYDLFLRNFASPAKLTSLYTPYHVHPSNFTYYLTLFSKFFPSFPYGTCFLSVSTLYLVLGDFHLPCSGCVCKQPYSFNIRRYASIGKGSYGTVTLFGRPFQVQLPFGCQRTILNLALRKGIHPYRYIAPPPPGQLRRRYL